MSSTATEEQDQEREQRQPPPRRPGTGGIVALLPLALFAAVAVFLALGLGRDPAELPSTLVGKPAPAIDLPPLPGRREGEAGFSRRDLGGAPMLVNVFASWCVPCRIEAPVMERLAEQGVVIHGIAYKDRPEASLAFLKELGDPYRKIGVDRDGRAAIEWGVYGVPETFVVDKEGRIAHRHVGPLQPRDVERTILPLLEKLR